MNDFKYISSWPTGSRYICDPPVTTTDNDTVFYVEDLQEARKQLVLQEDWEEGGSKSDENSSNWFSVKKTIDGSIENYIVTDSQENFSNWVTATELCKTLNLLKKEDRIAVFNVIVEKKPVF